MAIAAARMKRTQSPESPLLNCVHSKAPATEVPIAAEDMLRIQLPVAR